MAEPTTNAAIRKRYENSRLLTDLGPTAAAGIGFGTWRQVDADAPALLVVAATAETDGTAAGNVTVQVDEDGGTTADYTLPVVEVPADNAAGTSESGTVAGIYLPGGAQYQVQNASDPNAANSLDVVREVTL